MKQSGNEQEVIVLGSGLGGLVAGTLLSKNNHPVLLLREKGYQPSYAIKGYHFVPFSNFSEKRVSPSLLKKISQALNLPFMMGTREEVRQAKVRSDKSKQSAVFQVVLPKARIDIFPQRFLSQKEWKREFPKEVAQIEEFYNELDQTQHLLQRLNGKKNAWPFFPLRKRSLIKKIFSFDPFQKERMDEKLSPFSREFREFIQLQLISWGNLYSNQFPLSLAAHILFEETNELNPDLDLEKLEKEILNQFLRSGGRIEEIDRVKKINLGWRKGLTLSLEGDSRVFQSQFLIFNSPLHRISFLLGKKGKELLKWGKKIKPLYVMVPLFLGIREKVIPVGMKDLLLSILDLEKSYHDGNVLFLSLSPKGDETKAPEGRRALTVESMMDVGKWEQTLLVDYQQGVMKHLYHLFPFLENYIEFVDFQWASDHVPKWSYSHFLYEATSDFYWREGVVPMSMSKNIYFVGKENSPYLGLEGEIFSGLTVAQQILKKYS
jgi:phytoene dehydrogenase-like protein